MPAVSARTIVGPRPIATKPAAVTRTSSSALSPPSGPISTAMLGATAWAGPSRGPDGSATSRASAVTAATASARDVTPATVGTSARPHCRAAATASARCRSRRLARRASSSFTTVRSVVHGTMASTPISTSFSRHQSMRSPLMSACSTVRCGRGRAARSTVPTVRIAVVGPTVATTAGASRPAPSNTCTASPTASRRARNRYA